MDERETPSQEMLVKLVEFKKNAEAAYGENPVANGLIAFKKLFFEHEKLIEKIIEDERKMDPTGSYRQSNGEEFNQLMTNFTTLHEILVDVAGDNLKERLQIPTSFGSPHSKPSIGYENFGMMIAKVYRILGNLDSVDHLYK